MIHVVGKQSRLRRKEGGGRRWEKSGIFKGASVKALLNKITFEQVLKERKDWTIPITGREFQANERERQRLWEGSMLGSFEEQQGDGPVRLEGSKWGKKGDLCLGLNL